MPDFVDVKWKIFPRFCALAEVGWTKPELKNFSDFFKRLNDSHLKRLQNLDIKYAHQ